MAKLHVTGADPRGGALGAVAPPPPQPRKRGCVNRHLTNQSALAPPYGQETSIWHAFDYLRVLMCRCYL